MSQGESGSSGSPHPPTTSATGQSAPAPAPAPASVSAPPPSRQQQQQPAAQRLRRTGEAVLQSPTTSVKALLADTSAAPPPAPAPAPSGTGSSSSRDPLNDNDDDTTKSYSEAVKEGTPNEGDASAGGGGDGVGQATATTTSSRTATSSSSDDKEQGKAPPSSSQSHPTPPTTFVNTDDPSHRPTFQHTLHDLRQFLMPFLKLLPFQSLQGYIKVLIGPFVRFIVRVVAKILHRWNFGLASNLAYDIHLLLWKWIINLFFREIRPRGAYKVPRTGPVLFVCGPHHNQFLDPLLLMTEVRLSANRRVSFLIAEKSYHRRFIGLASKIAHSIPVARAADYAAAGKGKLYLTTAPSSTDDCIIKGKKTEFTKQMVVKGQIQLGKPYGFTTAEIVQVIDDETVKIRKMFGKDKAVEDLLAAGEKIAKGEEGAGLAYKTLPYIDQTKMYSSVYKKLSEGGCIGIFPEGGSHDRTDFLPLKHGLAIMALGAMAANPYLKVRIVPVGLNYFHAHRFRSRAVIEFGNPIDIPSDFIELFSHGGQDKRNAIGKVMELVFDGLKSVTVRAPDYDTLMVIQASRRLYKPPGQQLNLSQVVDLNKKFIMGYNAYRDEPKVKDLYKKVEAYNKTLRQLGIKDHQVDGVSRPWWKALLLLLWRTGLISAWTLFALPGIVMNAPIFIAASTISRKKAKEALAASTVKIQARDVLATWKVLVSLGMAPVLYGFYTFVAMLCVYRYNLGRKYLYLTPLFMMIAVPTFGYSALRFGEVGMDIYKSLPPLFKSLLPSHSKQLENLRRQRHQVAAELTETIEEFAPRLWKDFESQRMIPHSEVAHAYSASNPGTPTDVTPKRKSSYGVEGSILQHPMTWIDEKLFGWSASSSSSSSRRRGSSAAGRTRKSSASEDSTQYPGEGSDYSYTPYTSQPVTPGFRSEGEEEPADYDDVVRAVDEKLQKSVDGADGGRLRLSRKNSARTKSQLSLTEMSNDGAAAAQSSAVSGAASGTAEQRRNLGSKDDAQ